MGFTSKTIWKKNDLPSIIRRLNVENSGASVTIGVHESKGSEIKKGADKLLLVDVATFHEFGTKDVPERSFIRSNDANNKAKYKTIIAELKDKIIFKGMNISTALGLLGEKIKLDIQSGIRKGLKPELKEKTIATKGSSTPLVDTGQLINGITYQVGKGDS